MNIGYVQVIPHYYAEGTSMSQLCKIHGWVQRKTPRRVFDAIIFSNEIDLLEIRMQVRGCLLLYQILSEPLQSNFLEYIS